MARSAEDLPHDPAVVLTNPSDDRSPAAIADFLAQLLAGPEPELDSLHAAGALRDLRADS